MCHWQRKEKMRVTAQNLKFVYFAHGQTKAGGEHDQKERERKMLQERKKVK